MRTPNPFRFSSLAAAVCLLLTVVPLQVRADDTDIYKPKVKHNVMVLMDTSASMNFGVYDNDVDYHDFYRYIIDQACAGGDPEGAEDVVAGGLCTNAYFYPFAKKNGRTKIYMIYGDIGFANGATGDAGDPQYRWSLSNATDTKTFLTANGEFEDAAGRHPGDEGYEGRLGTVVDSGTGITMVTMDGQRLPNNRDIAFHDWTNLPDNSRIDKGFSGLMRAPGTYFSGYFVKDPNKLSLTSEIIAWFNRNLLVTDPLSRYISDPDHEKILITNTTVGGETLSRKNDFFFVPGNWLNMQAVYNLEIKVGEAPPVTCGGIDPITAVSVVWNGEHAVDVVMETGESFQNVQPGDRIVFPTFGAGDNVSMTLYYDDPGDGSTDLVAFGSSSFDISCSNTSLDGTDDCGSSQGTGVGVDGTAIDWLLAGMAGENGSFQCSLNESVEAWPVVPFPAADFTDAAGNAVTGYRPTVDFKLSSPAHPGNYPAGYDSRQDGSVNYLIYNSQSARMRLHFSALTLADGDVIELLDHSGTSVATITSMPTGGWTGWIAGNQIRVQFTSDGDAGTVAPGWLIDAYQYQSASDYDFFTRLEVAADALAAVVSLTSDKANWGFTTFDKTGGGDGAEIPPLLPIDPTLDPESLKVSLVSKLSLLKAQGGAGGTPLGEALQDIAGWFADNQTEIYESCNKNFVIVLTDGFPDTDDQWNRLDSAYDFSTNTSLQDEEQYTQDPFQFTNPPDDYFDDVAGFMYTRSWVDTADRNRHDLIPEEERSDSPDNIVVHNIGFTIDSPMLAHASEDLSGGIYITASSKAQLVNAFYSLGLTITEYTSYTAPVVSVDEANRTQSGDKLYMALFKPNESLAWTGNLKKYGLADGSTSTCDPKPAFVVVDGSSPPKAATACDGTILPDTRSFWSTETDGGDVEQGGAGEVLFNAVPANIGVLDEAQVNASGFRNIKTSLDGSTLITVATDTLSPADLGLTVGQEAERNHIVNYIYGYTYSAHDGTSATEAGGNAEAGGPKNKRWPLGAIIHSEPQIIDYLNNDGSLNKRYIVVGANDGMLHIFDDTDGREVLAFIPPAVLPQLQQLNPDNALTRVYLVDGSPMLVRKTNGDRLLVFGLRRGGRAFYALNVSSSSPGSWTLEWVIGPSVSCGGCFGELGQTWSQPVFTRIQTGTSAYKNVMIFGGGYDPAEDRADNDDYTLDDGLARTMGRGIFIVDVDTGLPLADAFFNGGGPFVRPSVDSPGGVFSYMKYAFTADPTVIRNANGLMLAAYLADVYGQVWKVRYHYDKATSSGMFYLNLIFQSNPMYDQPSAYESRSSFVGWVRPEDPVDTLDSNSDPRAGGRNGFTAIQLDELGEIGNSGDIINPRRTFYSPDVSYAGNDYTDIPVLFLATGDREHPTFIGSNEGSNDRRVKNVLFAFYDAEAYYREELGIAYDDADAFNFRYLLNVTCGALEPDVTGVSADEVTGIQNFLRYGAKGWYLHFDYDQSLCPFSDGEDHSGEKGIAPVTLFAGTVFAPTFQPSEDANSDPCVYEGAARVFAVDYNTGNAAFNFLASNDVDLNTSGIIDPNEETFTHLDRYTAIGSHIPSGISIMIRDSKPGGFISVGGKIVSPEVEGPKGMIPHYWWEQFREN